jgi:hypothetical protein
VITANQVPDHATVARFRARHERAVADLFGGVLALCAKAGLVKVGIVAGDGTKIAAAATHHATRSYVYGEARGDELPEGLRTSGDRRKWLREAKQALEAERAAKARPVPRSRPERQLERRVVEGHAAWHARGIASDGSRRMAGARANIKPYPLPRQPAGKLNVTDPDSRNLKTTRGWVQGYNAQAAVTAEQIVVAAEISIESLDTANLKPMVETARQELEAAGVTDKPGVVLADAGYWKNDRSDHRRRHPNAGRARRGQAKRTQAGPSRRPLRLHPESARDGLGQGALPQAPGHRRASRRPDQVEPRCQPLLTPRQIGREIGVAPPRRDPQPAQAPPTSTGSHLRPGGVPHGPEATSRQPPPWARQPTRPPALRDTLRE